MRPFRNSRDKNFPHTAPKQFSHRVNATIPNVEIANHADAPRVWRPDRKINTALAADLAQMRAKLVVKPLMRSLSEKMQIHLAHDRAVAVRIAQQLLRTIKRDHLDQIGEAARLVRNNGLVKSFDMQSFRRKNFCLVICRDDLDLLRFRPENANHQIVPRAVRAEDAKWIVM